MIPASEVDGSRKKPRLVAVVLAATLVVYAVLAYGYATLTPPWQNPDEPAHYNYTAFVATGRGLPELKAGDWDSALLERLKNGRLQPGDSIDSIRYENWQPPLTYVLSAPAFMVGSREPTAALLRLRAFDVVLGGLTLLVAYFVARDLLPRVAPAVPLAMLGIPMFTAVCAGFSADPLANLLSAAVVLVLVRRARQGPPTLQVPWAVAAGALIGLGLLTKLALGMFVPLALAIILVRSRRPVREAAVLLVTIALLVAPWLVHQVTTYGWADPLALARHSAVVADQPRFPGLSAEYVGAFATTSFHSFWAQFGWMAIVAQPRLYLAWGIVTLLAVLGLAIQRCWARRPEWRLLVAGSVLALIAYLGYNLTFEQPQGRYLFPALVPIALLLVAGWARLAPTRLQAATVMAIGTALIALNAYALLRVLAPGFAPIA